MATSEVPKYRAMPIIPDHNDPMECLVNEQFTLLHLTHLAWKYLVVKATSVPAERVFSTAG